MGLVEHAQRELSLAGLDKPESDYGGTVADAVLQLVGVFADQNHSGGSAMTTLEIFDKLVRFKTLTPVTSNPEEWIDRSDYCGGEPLWQNRRDPSLFSRDGGRTWNTILDDAPEDMEAGNG